MLGYGYSIEGIVEHGYHRGTSLLQIPTANLKLSREFIVPYGGVYAGLSHYKGAFYPTMINIGTNPTFKNKNIAIYRSACAER